VSNITEWSVSGDVVKINNCLVTHQCEPSTLRFGNTTDVDLNLHITKISYDGS